MRLEYAEGHVYEGDIDEKGRNGKGKLTFPNGSYYIGDWKNDLPDGQGWESYEDGSYYEGGFKAGRRDGFGTMNSTDGGSYRGEWKAGACNGQGVQKYPEGSAYDGPFKNGMRHGTGLIRWENGIVKRVVFEEDVPVSISEVLTVTTEMVKAYYAMADNEPGEITEEDYQLNANMANICNELTGFKISGPEMLWVCDQLLEVLRGERPDLAVLMQEKDKIRVPYRLLEELPPTRGEYSHEEKLLLAYCAHLPVFQRGYEPDGSVVTGLSFFTSKENIRSSFDMEMRLKPDFFDVPHDVQRDESEPFGYSPENPVQCTSVRMEYDYVRRLRTMDGEPLEVVGQSVMSGMKDCLELSYVVGGEEKRLSLFFYGYSVVNSMEAPEGFVLLEDVWFGDEDEDEDDM